MWFTETAWPPMVLLSVLAIASIWWWSQRRQPRFLILALLCAAGIAGTYIAERIIVSDREQIEAFLFEMADAFDRRDADGILKFISPRQDELIDLVNWGFEIVTDVEHLHITDVSVEILSRGSRARAHFRANGRFHVKGFGDIGHKPTRWELTWQREGGEWKIIEIHRLNPMTGEEIDRRASRE